MEREAVETSGGAAAAEGQPPAPVLAEKRKMMKVMVAVDESEESFYALKWALDHLFPEPAVEGPVTEPSQEVGMITVVHALHPFQTYVAAAGPVMYATTTTMESVRRAQKENAAKLLSCAAEMCKQKMIKEQTLILEGDPKDMICQASEEMHVDLLVVGSRGLGKIKRAFLGSVSDYCAHHAKCPILIVKPPK